MKEYKDFKKIAIQAALKAGDILNKNRGRVKKVDYKGKINIVTEIDLLSEKTILKIIKKNFPDHSILTEESKEQKRDSIYRWIIDPLDGTTNYAHDFPSYCISLALEKEGKVILGVVYNPLLEELFTAEIGKGAFLFEECFANRRRIRVSSTKDLSRSFLATGFPYDIRESRITNLDHFANFAVRSLAIRRAGSAALDLCYLAMGRFDGFWELKLSPWDTAAATLLVQEAGGKVTDFEGKKYSIYSKHILATNGRMHQQMIKVLKSGKF